eukprot:GHVQ01015770.1.p1 GENE.GHVQ01015770.1~~GHVQ01015770.1.p1  ORF type:complete len:689 (+),score=17.75 GHVQ01015770.1:648-2714(+)
MWFCLQVFHVGQATQYYRGNWNSWDPSITTPFGLYLITIVTLFSVVYVPVLLVSVVRDHVRLLVHKVFGNGVFSLPNWWDASGINLVIHKLSCSPLHWQPVESAETADSTPSVATAQFSSTEFVVIFRTVNAVIFFFACTTITMLLVDIVHEDAATRSPTMKTFRVLRIMTAPTHIFYFYLYYTDGLSVTLVLTSYYLMLRSLKQYRCNLVTRCHNRNLQLAAAGSGITGAFSICVRQTNVVWVFGVALLGVWHIDPDPSLRIFWRLLYSVAPMDYLSRNIWDDSVEGQSAHHIVSCSPLHPPVTRLRRQTSGSGSVSNAGGYTKGNSCNGSQSRNISPDQCGNSCNGSKGRNISPDQCGNSCNGSKGRNILPDQCGILSTAICQVCFHIAGILVFLVFVVCFNDGYIALGHREYHSKQLHSAQVVYLLAFILLHCWLDVLRQVWRALTCSASFGLSVFRSRVGLSQMLGPLRTAEYARGVLTQLVCVAVFHLLMRQSGEFVHPFLLADNRHYTFYVWKDILRFHVVRLWIVPLVVGVVVGSLCCRLGSIASSFCLLGCCRCGNSSLGIAPSASGPSSSRCCTPSPSRAIQRSVSHFVYVAVICFCSCVSLIPAGLIEVRYFTVPLLLVLLHLPVLPPHNGHFEAYRNELTTEFFYVITNIVVNAIVIYVFVFRHFAMQDETTGRFMF